MEKAQVNIVIVSWNALNFTKLTIESLFHYTKRPFCMTIVDNGSRNDTLKYLDFLKPNRYVYKIRIIKNKTNKGYGVATIQGIKAFKTKYACICNNDIVFSEGWLDKMFGHIEANPEIGILGTLRPATFVRYPDSQQTSKAIVDCVSMDNYTSDPKDQLRFYCRSEDYDNFVRKIIKINNNSLIRFLSVPPSFVSTCCALINIDVAKKVGGVADRSFNKYGSEDVDLSWRIAKAGYSVAIANNVYIHHFRHKALDNNNFDREKYVLKNNITFFKKWEGDIKKFLKLEIDNGKNVNKLMSNEMDDDYWFLRRLNKNVVFWKNKKTK